MEVKTKQFRVKLAFDTYSVGQLIAPVGLWRGELLSRGFIEPVPEQHGEQQLDPPLNRHMKKRVRQDASEQL